MGHDVLTKTRKIQETDDKIINMFALDLFLYVYPYTGGSPDHLVSCSCCEKACLEVNCPMSISNTPPQGNTVKFPYLVKDENNKISLNLEIQILHTMPSSNGSNRTEKMLLLCLDITWVFCGRNTF